MFKIIDGDFCEKTKLVDKTISGDYCLVSGILNPVWTELNGNISNFTVYDEEKINDLLGNSFYSKHFNDLKRVLTNEDRFVVECVLCDSRKFIAIVDFKHLNRLDTAERKKVNIKNTLVVTKEQNQKKSEHIGCAIFACLIIAIVHFSDYSKNGNTESLTTALFFSSPLLVALLWNLNQQNENKKQREERLKNNLNYKFRKKNIQEVLSNKKLLILPALLNNAGLVKDFIAKESIDLEPEEFKNILNESIEKFEQDLQFKLINICGAVSLKKDLLEKYDVDLSIIDYSINQIEEVLPITADDLLTDICSHKYEINKHSRFIVESRRTNLNDFYERQNEEITNLLTFGVESVRSVDFKDELKRINNLKYYPSHLITVPFNPNELEQKYKSGEAMAFEFYNTRVLKNSIYPNFIKKDFELTYKNESKILVVDYCLPNVEDTPTIKQINKQLNEVQLKEKEINAVYENVLYQVTLRTIYEILYNDTIDAIDSVVFNGWLDYTDRADGHNKISCILSMQAKKDEFMEISLENVDAKACFRKFKGISCNNLSTIVPIKPILLINREDKRFIPSYEVLTKLNDGENLALMDWQDFENLVQELFQKEFSDNGAEVKITQSSRDGGVDAVIYDPDPLRGGKIVIQAKRYINVVGVSAVRDLYGTMLNEGAARGILVCTSHYGVDSYEFAKNKPITLLEGSHLLHLLEKHGYKFKIDTQEAKALRS